jgi:histidinol-phosphate aminotransferase
MNAKPAAGENPFWNGRVKSLSPYVPGEQPRAAGIVKLNTNENPYPPSPKALEAARAAADGRLRLYPDPDCLELRTAIAERYNVGTEMTFAGNGSDEALAFAFGAFFSAGPDAAPVQFPDLTYSFYPVYARLWGLPFKEIPLDKDFSVNADSYAPEGGAVLPNPNAPTGIALPAETVVALAKRCAAANSVLVADEAYQAFGGESVIPFTGENPGLLVVRTLSKQSALAGLRVGFAIGHAGLIEALERVRDSFNSYTLDAVAQAAAAAALRDSDYYEEITQKIIATRRRVTAALSALGFTTLPSSANFIFTSPPPPSSAASLFALLRQNRILVRHFSSPRALPFLRVTVGLDPDMDAFLSVCQRAINNEQ